MIEISIVDDMPEEVRRIEEYIGQYGREHELGFSIRKFNSANELLVEDRFSDILFLDICMPGTDGLQLARHIRRHDENCLIVFITTMAQYAINGYEVSAADFIVKPVRYASFSFKFERLLSLARRRREESVFLTVDHEKQRMNISDIFYIEVIRHQLIYHTARGDLEAWGTMSKLAEEYEPMGFSLCNACYLVNLKHVERITDDLVTVHGQPLKISRNRKKPFMDALTGYGG